MGDSSQALLIFDFDGTLANTLETGVVVYNEIASDFGLQSVTMDEVRKMRKLHTRALLKHLGISRLKVVKLGVQLRKGVHAKMDEVDMIEGAHSMIMELYEAGFRLGIISSNSAENVKCFMERFGLLKCFDFIEAGVSLFGKARRIKSALKAQGVSAQNAMYVGDETRDMEAARKAKVCTVAVCWGVNDHEAMMSEDPDYCIETPGDLIACAEKFSSSSSV